jgi:chemotaxis protein MotB
MARRKSEDERDNHERWLVSYADFITLLFAFFVVMYALSSVNEGKYRILSNSMVSAFRNIPVNSAGQTPMIMPPPPPAAAPSSLATQGGGQAETARENASRGEGHS